MEVAVNNALLPVIDQIYESVERPELWPETIYRIGECIGGRCGFWGIGPGDLYPGAEQELNKHLRRAGSHASFLSRADLRALDQYVDQFGELIVRFLKIICVSALFSQTEVDDREIIGVRLARRYLRAFEPVAGTSVSVPSRSASRKLIAALWEDGCVFSGDGLDCIRGLIPHLDRALRLQMRLSAADLHATMASGALDYLTLGVVFINRAARPLWLNRRAKEILQHSKGLRLSSGGLAANSASETRALREQIAAAVSEGAHGVLAIGRGCDSRPLLLFAVPLKPNETSAETDNSACGAVFISDPDRIDGLSVDALRRAFDLTHREAQTAIAVTHGHGLQTAADSMGVAVTTARSQLQQAFAKTGTNSQAELAALVHRMLSPLRHG
jgi:DNA-binding CsgD family transcriptional regulator